MKIHQNLIEFDHNFILLQVIRPKLQMMQSDAESVIPKDALNWLYDKYKWYYDKFNYKK